MALFFPVHVSHTTSQVFNKILFKKMGALWNNFLARSLHGPLAHCLVVVRTVNRCRFSQHLRNNLLDFWFSFTMSQNITGSLCTIFFVKKVCSTIFGGARRF